MAPIRYIGPACTWLLTVCLTCLPMTARAETWYWRLSTDHITVVSDGSARRCEKLAAQFFAFERMVRELANLDEDFKWRPLTVYSLSQEDARRVFLSEADRQQELTRRMRIFSKYLPGSDFNVAAIVDGADGNDEPLQAVLLLYAESTLISGPTQSLPLWYQFGVANVTNGALIRDDGSILLNREGVFEPDVLKRARAKYDLGTLLITTAVDLSNGGDWRAYTKQARDWAQYGLLTSDERRARYRELATLMRQGASAEQAVPQAFGVSLAEVSKEFDAGGWRRQAQYKVPSPADRLTLPAAERIDSAQANALLQVIADRVALQAPR